ncbi:MAG: glucose-6-phosphate dehydrogenase [Pseudomonadota bacterium]
MAKLVPVDTFDLLIFGGTGDLSMRKLLPSLYHRYRDGQIPDDSRIVAIGRGELSHPAYIGDVEAALGRNLKEGDFQTEVWERFAQLIFYFQADALDPTSWGELTQFLQGHEERVRTSYLATAPSLFGSIADGLSVNGLITPNSRIVLEKPVGHDAESAAAINDAVGASFREDQVYRIDHYLGKETVQNLLALRFANSLFEPLWRRGVVDHVQITVAEHLGVGGRTEFYNATGALRDMVQNHIMQLVCLVAMEPPDSLDHGAVRDEKLKVLRALRPITAADAKLRTVRGQYTAGAVAGEAVPGFAEELGSTDSTTETFAALRLDIDNWRWSGVPFYLRTGKRLKRKHSEIVVQFRPVPHSIFTGHNIPIPPNRLSIQLQPDEGVKLSVMSKEPGPGGFDLRSVSLDLSFEETFGVRYPDAYERLLMEVLRGNPALFMRRDEVEAAWDWVDGILESWEVTGQRVENYTSGSWGPAAAATMLDRDGRTWYPDE